MADSDSFLVSVSYTGPSRFSHVAVAELAAALVAELFRRNTAAGISLLNTLLRDWQEENSGKNVIHIIHKIIPALSPIIIAL